MARKSSEENVSKHFILGVLETAIGDLEDLKSKSEKVTKEMEENIEENEYAVAAGRGIASAEDTAKDSRIVRNSLQRLKSKLEEEVI